MIELIAQFLFEGSKPGEINNEATVIQLGRSKPQLEAAAIAVHEAAMTRMSPLPVAAGIALKQLAAGEGCGGNDHAANDWEERRAGDGEPSDWEPSSNGRPSICDSHRPRPEHQSTHSITFQSLRLSAEMPPPPLDRDDDIVPPQNLL